MKQEFDSIATALRAVNNGQIVFGTEIVDRIPHLFSGGKDALKASCEPAGMRKVSDSCMEKYDINEKELGIIKLIAEGLNNKEIAEKLFLSEGTVRNYISTILEKTQLRDRTQLACFYYKNLL